MTQTIKFIRTDGPGTVVAARNVAPDEARELIAALVRLPHIARAWAE